MLANFTQFFFVYFIVWWLCFFAVLPIGMERDESPQSGNDAGAPKKPMIKKKIIMASAIALFVSSIIIFVLSQGVMDQFRV